MATKKNKTEKIEREYTIPLRERCRSAVSYKKAPKAIKTIKEFLAKHMKVENRDLNKVKLDKFVNEAVWARGIKKPLHKIKIKAIKEDGVVSVELAEISKKFEDKKTREERRSALGNSNAKKKTAPGKKAKDKDDDGVKDSVEVIEKEKSLEETNQEEIKKEFHDEKDIESGKNKTAMQKKDRVARLKKTA